jgi:ribosome-associated toxin RatA of RatAB toxin-antitoxin module
MPDYGECQHIEIAAPRERCYDALLDAEALPRWQRALRAARVLERDAEGRPAVLEYEVDARVRTVRYRIRQRYFPPARIVSEYLGGDFRDFGGEWRFAALAPDRTRVELDLTIDPGRFVPGPVRALIGDAVMRRALADLKAHLEATPTPVSQR